MHSTIITNTLSTLSTQSHNTFITTTIKDSNSKRRRGNNNNNTEEAGPNTVITEDLPNRGERPLNTISRNLGSIRPLSHLPTVT